jgi:hypothetical protein
VECVGEFSDPAAKRWAFKATVFKSGDCKGFVGYGDADPSVDQLKSVDWAGRQAQFHSKAELTLLTKSANTSPCCSEFADGEAALSRSVLSWPGYRT